MNQNFPSLVEPAIIKRLEKLYTQKGGNNTWSIGYYFKKAGNFLLNNWLLSLIILGICYFLYIRYQAKQDKVIISRPNSESFGMPTNNMIDDIYSHEYTPTQHMELINELMDDYQKEDEQKQGSNSQMLAIEDQSSSTNQETCQPCQIMSPPEDFTPQPEGSMAPTTIMAANEASMGGADINRGYLPPNNTNMYDTYSLSTGVVPANGDGKHATPFSGYTLLN